MGHSNDTSKEFKEKNDRLFIFYDFSFSKLFSFTKLSDVEKNSS